MSSTRNQKCDAGSSRSTSPAKAPHFFKLVHSANVEKQMLRIPPKFVRKYGKNLSNTIFLKVPSGAEWRMELKKGDGEVWLDKGWQDFADYYSIVFGHFLVFRYHGNSCFHVFIFDKSTSEIEYPFDKNHGEEIKMEECEDDVSVEILDHSPYERKEKTPLQCRQPPYSQSYGKRVKLEKINGADVLEKRPAAASATDKFRALKRANAHKSDNPRFILTMRPSYVSFSFNLNMPLWFVRKYFTKKHNNVYLRVSEKTWSAKYRRRSNYSKLYGGWREFTEDNHLRIGDVCVFELIKEVENSLEVVIFRDNEGAA